MNKHTTHWKEYVPMVILDGGLLAGVAAVLTAVAAIIKALREKD